MINDNTILSSFDDKPTLLEWLKKVEDALKTDTAKSISVENPEPNTYVFKITFADGDSISSGNVVFPNAVQDVSIKNGHIIVTQISGTQTDLGVINPYADTIVLNAETNDVEINGETKINAGLEVLNEINCDNIVAKGAIQTDTDLNVTGNAQVNGRLQVNSYIISNGEIRGGNISGTKFLLGTEEMPLVKANPTGEATETLEKIKIGNVAYKVGGGGGGGGGGGSNYTAGNNIEISEANEISLKSDITGINSFKFAGNSTPTIGVVDNANLKIKSNSSDFEYPAFNLYRYGYDESSEKRLSLIFKSDVSSYNSLFFDARDFGQINYAFITKGGKVPPIPSGDGTYILKASVSGGKVTYIWELQQ